MGKQTHHKNAKGAVRITPARNRRTHRRQLRDILQKLAIHVREMIEQAGRMFTIAELKWLIGWRASPNTPLPI